MFLVEWQELVYDNFDKLKEINSGPPFELEASSLERARETAEKEVTRRILQKQKLHPTNDFLVAKVVALIDEAGVRHQFLER